MEAFVEKALSLIAQERDAETSESQAIISSQLHSPTKLEAKGICLSRLHVTCQNIGLYGRHVVVFEQSLSSHKPLPSSSLTTGDIVGLFVHDRPLSDGKLSGIVVGKTTRSLSVAFDQLDDSVDLSAHNGALLVVKLSNDVTYCRMKRALEDLRTEKGITHLVRVLFGESQLSPPDTTFSTMLSNPIDIEKFPFYNTSLNESQRRAVLLGLSRPDVAVIHGPPGTGKTTTVVELILQAVRLGHKVLACAASNIAVDNMVERLAQAKAKVVRVGHPARVSESIQQLSLDALLHSMDAAEIIMDVRQDIRKALTSLQHSRGDGERSRWRGEIKALKKELQHREQRAIRDLLRGAAVVLGTTTGVSPDGPLKHLPQDHFGLTVVDECAQAVEASCWIPLLYSPKCVLAGDHKQLPPTIISQEAAKEGLALSLMERVTDLHGTSVTALLNVQYRMNQRIMMSSSKYFYENKLQAHSSVGTHTLSELVNVSSEDLTATPLLFIDTAGCHMTELETEDAQSKGNEGEADLVVHHLKALVSAGVSPSQLAVIAPYSLQVELVRKRLVSVGSSLSSVEVHTVDGFQGREMEAVIISFTRSNNNGEYGFLSESRRTNVAVTRARRHIALIGDSNTITHEPFIKELLNHCYELGEVWSAREYVNDPNFESGSFSQPPLAQRQATLKQHSTDKSERVPTGKSGSQSKKPPKPLQRAEHKFTKPNTSTLSVASAKPDSRPFEVEIAAFVSGPEIVLTFSCSLTSRERRIVHEICEELGLLHESRGEGNERYIEVRKKIIEEAHETTSTATVVNTDESITQQQDPLPSKNIGEITPTRSLPKEPERKDVTKKPKKKPQTQKPKGVLLQSESDEFDKLLSEVAKLDSMCAHSKCKKSVKLVSVKCSLCSRRYCLEHSLPEVHGCGEAAKRSARQTLMATGGAASRASVDRAKLQRKLHERMNKLSKKDKEHAK